MSTKKIISGAVLAFLLSAGAAGAQTYTDTSTDTAATGTSATTSDVGVPNTGAGGNAAANFIVLGSSAAIALAGLAYLSRRNLPE